MISVLGVLSFSISALEPVARIRSPRMAIALHNSIFLVDGQNPAIRQNQIRHFGGESGAREKEKRQQGREKQRDPHRSASMTRIQGAGKGSLSLLACEKYRFLV